MRRSLPPKLLISLAGAGVAVLVAILATVVTASAAIPLAAMGVGAVMLALTVAGLARDVLGPLDDLAEALDPAADEGEGVDQARPDPGAVTALARRPDAIGRVAGAAAAHAARAQSLEQAQTGVTQSLASTMSDMARRELALVGRLLEQLDVMEREETDPVRLERLYQLDHLAVRLRGQSENVLVVADQAPAGDPDEAPMHVVDLVRVAASQTEDYRRVRADANLPGEVVGWASRPLAQLLAALLDNGLRYSPPTQPVVISGRVEADGLELRIRDRGLGMDERTLAEAAAVIAAPPLLEAARTRRLGLYVVGVLAQRLGVRVQLSPADDAAGGTVASLRIPRNLLLGLGDAPAQLADASAPADGGTTRLNVADLASEMGWNVAEDGADPVAPAASATAPTPPVAPPTPPVPTATAPSDPAPVDPAPVDPAPVDPAPVTSAPVGPAPVGPGPRTTAPAIARRAEDPGAHSEPAEPDPAAPAADGAPEERRGRRKRGRAEVAWSIALHPTSHPTPPSADDAGYVNDTSGWTAAPTAPPAAPAADGPALPSRPVYVPAGDRSPGLDTPAASDEPDDYIPPVIDNPILDILPEHPTAQLSPVLPSVVDQPQLHAPAVMDGIRMAGAPASTARATGREPDDQGLPTRARAAAEPDPPPTDLFGASGRAAAPPADDLSQFDALASLLAGNEE